MSSNCYQCGCDPDHQPKVVAALKSRIEELTKALTRARNSVNAIVLSTHSVSFEADLRVIDKALAMPLEQSGSGK